MTDFIITAKRTDGMVHTVMVRKREDTYHAVSSLPPYTAVWVTEWALKSCGKWQEWVKQDEYPWRR